ncbi:MAG: hypothetical protein ACQEP1_05095 [Nanobdellota archaeon]
MNRDPVFEPEKISYKVKPLDDFEELQRIASANNSCIGKGSSLDGIKMTNLEKYEKAKNDFYNPEVDYFSFDNNQDILGYIRIFNDKENNGWIDGMVPKRIGDLGQIIQSLQNNYENMFFKEKFLKKGFFDGPETLDKKFLMDNAPEYSMNYEVGEEYEVINMFEYFGGS